MNDQISDALEALIVCQRALFAATSRAERYRRENAALQAEVRLLRQSLASCEAANAEFQAAKPTVKESLTVETWPEGHGITFRAISREQWYVWCKGEQVASVVDRGMTGMPDLRYQVSFLADTPDIFASDRAGVMRALVGES